VISPLMLIPRGIIGLELKQDIMANILRTPKSLIKRTVVGLHFSRLLSPSVGGVNMVSA